MSLANASPEDPRGVIAESYAIDGLSEDNARSIFLDWAMMDAKDDPKIAIQSLLDRFGTQYPDHPMTQLLQSGLQPASSAPKRKGRPRK